MEQLFLENAVQKLLHYIEEESYCGYDPYDALKSPLFKLPFFRSNKFIRFSAQQLVKRFPLNLRPLLFIPKGKNPVTLGLCIQAYAFLIEVFPEKKNVFKEKIIQLFLELQSFKATGYHGDCWGYDFDWEARYASIPAYKPTVVATGIITNALYQAYQITGNEKLLESCKSATQFVLKDLNRTVDEHNNFCFSYSPFDKEVVFNASMKGARLLAQMHSQTKDENMKDAARKAVAFVMKYQQENGSWIYSASETGGWVDNYHTGYILDCLDEYIKCTGDISFQSNLSRGFIFYRKNFFEFDGLPKFYNHSSYPVDCTAAGQSILTLVRFGENKLATDVAQWMISNMQHRNGYFYFRKFKIRNSKTSFMRWSQAWMFASLSSLLKSGSRNQTN